MPTDSHPALSSVLKEHERLFRRLLGSTGIVEHVIDTGDAPPVKVPPCSIPLHFTTGTVCMNNYRKWQKKEFSDQTTAHGVPLQPRVNEEIRMCGLCELNRTPRINGPQQKLDHKQVFSPKSSAYWQFCMSEASIEKHSALDQVTDSVSSP